MIYDEKEILSGYNFARISDIVYAENLIDEQNNPIPTVFNVDPSEFSEGSIIFCKTDFILDLFHSIKIFPEWYNFKIITHESDYEINEKYFNLKPKCINKWFGININFNNKNLVPIPLGLGNSHSKITLKINNINNFKKEKNKLLYVNHRTETYPSIRKQIYQNFINKSWCTIDNPNLSLHKFSEQLTDHKFMICPRGNGIDTHRLWECLYADVIPVVQNHITNKNMKDLPILFVDSFDEVNENLLNDSYDYIKNKKIEKLNINWWKEYIKGE